MANYRKTVSGTILLPTAVANGASLAVAYPPGTSREDWMAVDLSTVRVVTPGQDNYGAPAVAIAIGTQLTITNSTGQTWPATTKLIVSAKQPILTHVPVSQASYDALAAKDPNVVYVVPGA